MITGGIRSQRGYQAALRSAHRSILEQHRDLRRLLALGLAQTCGRSGDHHAAPEALRALVSQIRTVFVAHLSHEVAALLPLLDGAQVDGPRRMQILREQHAWQRREIETLYALSQAGKPGALVDRFDQLARALLVDIAEEERELALAVAPLPQAVGTSGDRGIRFAPS